jgi:hypothetical protein
MWCYPVHAGCLHVFCCCGCAIQIEQEMEFILMRPGVFDTFSNEWKHKWVPAIIAYCQSLKKKDILSYISTHEQEKDSSGTVSVVGYPMRSLFSTCYC